MDRLTAPPARRQRTGRQAKVTGGPEASGRAMDETEPTPENINLTAEQIVAADTAMLLDLGGAEELAEMIATQTLGAGDTVADRTSSLDVDLNPATPE